MNKWEYDEEFDRIITRNFNDRWNGFIVEIACFDDILISDSIQFRNLIKRIVNEHNETLICYNGKCRENIIEEIKRREILNRKF